MNSLQARKIKDLSIALEALSRIGGHYSVLDHFDAINAILKKELDKEKASDQVSDPDDEIPF